MRAYIAVPCHPVAIHTEYCVTLLRPTPAAKVSVSVGTPSNKFPVRAPILVGVFQSQKFLSTLIAALTNRTISCQHLAFETHKLVMPSLTRLFWMRFVPLYTRHVLTLFIQRV